MTPGTVGLILTLALGLATTPLAAHAQQPARVARIGFLAAGSPPSGPSPLDAFRQGLRDLGWIEGQNIAIEYRWAAGKFDRLPALAAELVQLKVDLIVASSPQPVRAAKDATTTIPIVLIAVADPVGMGLVKSLARPGGNITGFSTLVSEEFIAKQFELLKEVVPRASRMAVLMNPTNQIHVQGLEKNLAAAEALRVKLQVLEAKAPDDLERAFEAATRERAEALNVLGDPLTFAHRVRIVELAAKNRLPAIYLFREFVEAGGLMAYGPSLPDLFRRGAAYVDRILKGAKPADLPVQQPTKFELVINLKAARALGLAIPQSLLIRADQVIQ